MTLKLYEKDKLIQRCFFQKIKSLWGGAYKTRINRPGQIGIVTISIKIPEFNYGKSILDNSKRDKIFIVGIGALTPLSKTTPHSFLSSALKSTNCPSSPF